MYLSPNNSTMDSSQLINAQAASDASVAVVAAVAALAIEESQEDSTLEIARVMDAIEEAQRSGEAYDQGDEECQCFGCLNADVYDDRCDDRYDDDDNGGGLDWNESGYFD